MATTVLAAAPQVTSAVLVTALRAEFTRAAPGEVGIEVEVQTSGDRVTNVVPTLRVLLDATLGPSVEPPDVFVSASTVRLRGQPEDVVTPVAVAESYTQDVLADRDLLREVRADRGPFRAQPVHLHEDALDALGVDVGDVLVTDRGAVVQVAGTLAPVDPGDRRWWDDAVGRDGVVAGPDATHVGPLYVQYPQDLEPLLGNDPPVTVRVRTLPVPGELTYDALPTLAERARALGGGVDRELGDWGLADAWTVRTPLADAASTAHEALVPRRVAVLVALGAVALLGIVLVVVADRRRGRGRAHELLLLRSWGATPTQLRRAAVLEAGLLVAPAVLAAPWLASQAVEVLPVLAAGPVPSPDVTPSAVTAAVAAGLVCIAVLVVPVVRRVHVIDRRAPLPADGGTGPPSLLPHLDVRRHVELPMAAAGLAARRRRATARRLLGLVGLADRAGDLPAQLSDAEQRSVVIATTLAAAPSAVLAVPTDGDDAAPPPTGWSHDDGPRPPLRWGPDGELLDP